MPDFVPAAAEEEKAGPWDAVGLGACRPIDDFTDVRRIGEGSYGDVFRARDSRSGDIVALKKVKDEATAVSAGYPISSLREASLLRRLQHPGVVALRGVAVDVRRSSTFLILEYCEHDLLDLFTRTPNAFNVPQLKNVLRQLLAAVAHLHDRWIVHRDLKLSNVLYDRNGTVKLADFGMARQFSHPPRPMTGLVVTLWYRAPELLLGAPQYGEAVDMWAYGCIAAELLTGRPVFRGNDELSQLDAMFRVLGAPTAAAWPAVAELPAFQQLRLESKAAASSALEASLPRGTSPLCVDLLARLFAYDPERRLTAHEALQHPFWAEAPLPCDTSRMPAFPSHHSAAGARAAEAPAGKAVVVGGRVTSSGRLGGRAAGAGGAAVGVGSGSGRVGTGAKRRRL